MVIQQSMKLKIAITDENDNQSNTTATTTTTTTTTTIDVQLTLLKSLMHRPEIGTKPKIESSQNLNPFLKPEPELTIVDNYNDDEFKIVLINSCSSSTFHVNY